MDSYLKTRDKQSNCRREENQHRNLRQGSDTVNGGGQQAFLFRLKDIFKRAWQGREEKSTLYCINESLTLDGLFSTALFFAQNSAINLAFMQVF